MSDSNKIIQKPSTQNHHPIVAHDSIDRQIQHMNTMMDNMFNKHELFLTPLFAPLPLMSPYRLSTDNSFKSNEFIERNGEYVCEIDISKNIIDFVKIKEKNGGIHISAEMKMISDNSDPKSGVVSKSSSVQSFSKYIQLPFDATKNTAVAKYANGKLIITVTKQ
jgi:HSP20 family molecular chaperone IbpA